MLCILFTASLRYQLDLSLRISYYSFFSLFFSFCSKKKKEEPSRCLAPGSWKRLRGEDNKSKLMTALMFEASKKNQPEYQTRCLQSFDCADSIHLFHPNVFEYFRIHN